MFQRCPHCIHITNSSHTSPLSPLPSSFSLATKKNDENRGKEALSEHFDNRSPIWPAAPITIFNGNIPPTLRQDASKYNTEMTIGLQYFVNNRDRKIQVAQVAPVFIHYLCAIYVTRATTHTYNIHVCILRYMYVCMLYVLHCIVHCIWIHQKKHLGFRAGVWGGGAIIQHTAGAKGGGCQS